MTCMCDVPTAPVSKAAAQLFPSLIRGMAALLVGVAIAPTFAAATEPADLMLPRDAIVADRNLDWYAQDWWQWAFSVPVARNPVSDQDGRFCDVGQKGPVWYLAGGFGTSRIHRTCTILAGRHLFFPIVNYLATTLPDQYSTCEEVRARVAQDHDQYVHLVVEVDGVRLPDLKTMRIAPDWCFDLAGRAAEMEPRPFYPSAMDGYWVMLAPLPAGEHRLEFRGFFSNSGDEEQMVQNIVYDLHIESAP